MMDAGRKRTAPNLNAQHHRMDGVNRTLIGPSLILLIACSMCVAQPSKSARVSVEVWTLAEDQLRDASITLVEFGTGKSIGNFRNGRAEGIPYGQYTLHIRRPGFKFYERRVSIEGSDIFVKVVLSVGNLPSKSSTLRGKLTSAGTADWIRLVPILDATAVEAEVENDGTFVVGGIENGDYVLIALRGLRAVLIRQLSIRGDMAVELELPPIKQ
jgi:hypothetical protein